MKVYNPQDIFNISVVGHGSEGKTTLVEATLLNSGAIERMGTVEDGNTVTDYDPEEAKRQFSIGLALAPVEWNSKKYNFIDVPGYFDFEGEAVAAYELCDSALIVMSPNGNVSVGAEKAYTYCEKNNIPRAFLISQMDKDKVDFAKTVTALETEYSTLITPVQYPIFDGENFVGIVDIVSMEANMFDGSTGEIPAGIADEVESYREHIVENAAGNDEELMEKYFEGEELTKADILSGLKAGVLQGDVVPVYVAAGLSNLGVKNLLDELSNLMPAASEIGPITAKEGDKEVEISRDPSASFAAQVIKTIADPFVGQISIAKIYSGTLTSATSVENVNTSRSEKTNNMGVMMGKKLIDIKEFKAGDIVALAKLQETNTGDTLAESGSRLKFNPIPFPAPSISLAVAAKTKGDEERVFSGLNRLAEEDPTFTITTNVETGDTLANGVGEMHLEVVLSKLKNKYKAEGVLTEPRVPYRETIKRAAEAEGRHRKQSGGAGQYGVASIRFEPITDGSSEFEFVDKIVGGVVPREYIPAVEKGLIESMKTGVLTDYPMVNVRATLFDGKYHPVDSKEVAFRSAARLAYREACAKANPIILEPIGKAEVLIPDEYMGDIIGDLNRRRGRILGMNPTDGQQVVEAEVPMSEMTKYATDLRSMTQAKGSFTIEFLRYEELPPQMAEKVIEAANKEDDED